MKQNAVSQRVQEAAVQQIPCDCPGLTEEQAAKNHQIYGSNALTLRSQNSLMGCIKRAFINPFSIILFVLAVISFLTEMLSKDAGNLRSVVIILAMLIISGCIRLVQELRSKRVADGLTRLVHTTVKVLRSGAWKDLPSEDIVVGDVVQIVAGDRVPADLRLTQAEDLFVSQSVITGETAILEKTADVLPQAPSGLNSYRNIAFMGTTVTGGKGQGIVLATGKDTVYGNFEAPERKKGFDRGAGAIAWVLIRFMAILVPVAFLASGLTHGDWPNVFAFALSVAVGLTPEMLPMRDGTEIILTPKEFDILMVLARNPGIVFTKDQIYRAVWENEYLLDDSNIMAFIRKLRKKIEPNPDAPEYILTVWGTGYKFNDRL